VAFDVLAVPVMSAEIERLFSSAGPVMTERRARASSDLAEDSQLLKAWLKERLITLWPSSAPLTTVAPTAPSEREVGIEVGISQFKTILPDL
jgi:hypothetical protein